MTKGFKKKRFPISALKVNTGIAYTDEEKAETLADSLENQFQLNDISNPTQDNNHSRLVSRFSNNENIFDDLPTSTRPSEIISIINNFNIRTAPGREDLWEQSSPTNSEARSGNASAPRFPSSRTPTGFDRLPPDWTAHRINLMHSYSRPFWAKFRRDEILGATRGLLATDHVILNHGQVTWTTPELAPPLLTTTPHQRKDVSALDRFNVHRCPTRRVFSGTGIEPVTKQATVRYLYHSATAATPGGKQVLQ
ncbi:uncharacterized protein TNCV_5009751 [Trichonephila clavipes]|nr:uncharacterized protein TNCV_5009751 [Trichonephila clavipes]